MSGILIDVDTRAESAKRDLQELNRNLAALIKNTSATGASFNKVKTDSFRNVTKDINSGIKAFSAFRDSGVKSVGAVDSSASSLSKTLNSVKNSAIALGSAFLALRGVNAFNKAADDLTNIQNRLKLVTNEADELIRKQVQIYNLSKETRSSFANTASTFVDFSKALQNTGTSQEKILNVVRTIQQASTISGSSAEAINGAMIQLNQGIASGTLRGEELNSVMEQMKYLGIGLQQVLGKNAGELRKFAEEGNLTTQVLLESLEKMAAQTQADFNKTSSTVEGALNRMKSAVSYSVGDFNKYYGISDKFANRLNAVTNGIEKANTGLTSGIFVLKESIKNYIKQFDLFDAVELTVKAALKLEISPLEVFDKYEQYKQIKSYLDKFQKFIGKDQEIKIKTKLTRPEGVDAQALSDDLDNIKAPSTKGLRQILLDLRSLAYELGRTVYVTFTNILKILPTVLGPVVSLVTSVTESIRNFAADLNAATYDAITPFTRSLQAVLEPLSGFLLGDTALERKWVNLFRSDSIESFVSNLRELNDVRSRIKFDDTAYAIKQAEKEFDALLRPIESVLISLNLLDNRLFKISFFNLDVAAKYLENIYRVVTRLYKDLLATTVEPIIARVSNRIKLIGETLNDIVTDYITEDYGSKIGLALTQGIVKALKGIRNLIKQLGSEDSIFDQLLDKSFADKIIGVLKKTLVNLASFVKGFFSGVFEGIVDSFSPSLFTKTFRKIGYAFAREFDTYNSIVLRNALRALNSISDYKFKYFFDFDKTSIDKMKYYMLDTFEAILEYTTLKLVKVEVAIHGFARRVKDIFFDIYDAVVGHSYWPDMIDGVVDYTSNLFNSTPVLERFSNFVKRIFSNLYKTVTTMGGGFGEAVGNLVTEIEKIDWSRAFESLRNSIGAAFIAGFGLLFGGTKLKLFAVSYFLSTFNATVNGALGALLPSIANAASGSISVIAKNAAKGLLSAVDIFVQEAPAILSGILSAVSPIVETISNTISQIPILGALLTNNLVSALLLAAGAFAIFAENGLDKLMEAFFGKTNKKGVKSDGVVDYIKAIFTQGAAKVDTSKSIIDLLFPSKKLAVAAAAAFSTALLDSVSIFQAASLGIPLLGFAIFGKDGGGKFATEAERFVIRLVKDAYFAGLDFLKSRVAGDSIVATMLDKLSFSGSSTEKARSRLSKAFGVFSSDFRQLFVNLRDNADDYTKGNKSLFQTIFTEKDILGNGFVMKGKDSKIKESLQDVFKEIGNIKIGSKNISEYFTTISSAFTNGYAKVKDNYKKSNLLEVISTNAKEIFSTIATNSRRAFSLIADGALLLVSLLKNKFVLFAGLVGGFTATAFAASDAATAVGELGSTFGKILIPIVAITAALTTFGVIARSVMAYGKGKSAFEASVLGGDFDSKQAKRNASELSKFMSEFDKGAKERRKAFEATHKNELAELIKTQENNIAEAVKKNPKAGYGEVLRQTALIDRTAFDRQQRDAFDKAEKQRLAADMATLTASQKARTEFEREEALKSSKRGARAAGIEAVKDYLLQSYQKAKTAVSGFVGALAAVVASPAMAASWWTQKILALAAYTKANIVTETVTARLTLANKALAESFALLKLGQYTQGLLVLGGAMKTIFTTSVGVTIASGVASIKGLWATLRTTGTVAGIAMKGLKGLWSLLGMLLKPLMALLKPFALIGAGITVVGALGLWLFGPGNSFISNIEWAYDKIRSLFGLGPSTKGGRQVEISQNLNTRRVDSVQFDFSQELSRIDFSKLSSPQVAVLKDVGATFKESIDQLEASFEKQGFLTEEQISAAKQQAEEVKGILLRQPAVAEQDLKTRIGNFTDEIMAVDNSLWAMFKRFVSYTPILTQVEDEASTVQKTFNYLVDSFTSWPAVIGSVVGFFLGGPLGSAIGASIGAAISAVIDGISYVLSSTADWVDEVTGISAFFNQLGDSISKFWNLVGGFKGIGEILISPITSFYEDFKNAFSVKPSDAQKQEAAFVKGVSANLSAYGEYLPAEVATVINGAFNEYQQAFKQREALIKRGYTGIEEKTYAEFQKKLNAADSRLGETRARYAQFAKVYGDFAEEEFKIKTFNKEMQQLSSEVKTLLDLDVGKFTEQFIGSPSDFKQLKQFVEEAKSLKYQKTRTFTTDARNAISLQEENLKNRAKALQEQAKAEARFESNLEFNIKVTGIDATVDDLRRVGYESESSLQLFNAASQEIFKIQQAIQEAINNDKAPEYIRKLYEELGQKKIDAITASFTSADFSQINKRLQAIGVDQITGAQFINFSESDAKNIASRIDKVRNAQQELVNASNSGKPFSEQIDALRVLQDEIRKTKLAIKQTVGAQVEAAVAAGGNAAEVASKIAQITGQELPKVASTNLKSLSRYNQLTAERLSLEGKNAALLGPDGNLSIANNATALVNNQRRLLEIDDALAKLEERNTFTFDSLTSSLSTFGVELDKFSFVGLSAGLQRELIGIGKALELSQKKLSELPAEKMTGPAFDKLLADQQTNINKAVNILEKSTIKSGTQISEILSNIGIEALNTISDVTLKTLLGLSTSVNKEKVKLAKSFDINTPKGLQDYLDGVRALTKAEKALKEAAEDANQTLQTRFNSFNEMFKTSLTEIDFMSVGSSIGLALGDAARYFKRELENVFKTGKTAAGQTGEAFVLALDQLQSRGVVFTFLAEYAKTLREVTYEGAKAGFDRLKAVAPDLAFEFKDFAKIDAARRRALATQGAQLSLLEKAAELPNLSEGMAEVLNNFKPGDDINATLDKFKAVFLAETKTTFEDFLKQAGNPQLTATEENTKALKELTAAYTGKPVSDTVSVGANLPKPQAVGNVKSDVYKNLETARTGVAVSASQAAMATGTLRDQIRIAGKGSFDTEALNLASQETLVQVKRLTDNLSNAQASLLTANEEAKPKLQMDVLLYKAALDDLATGIKERAFAAKRAGEEFSNSMISGIRSALYGYLTGQAEDDKSIFRTFLDSLLQTFTSTVINSFINGLLNPLTGKDGILTQTFQNLGASIFTQSAGLTGAKPAEGQGTDSLSGMLSGIFTSLLSFFGIQMASDALALTQEQVAMGYYGTLLIAIPTAITASTTAIVTAIASAASTIALSNAIPFATGGYVSGPGTGTSDSIAAMLSNGEYVINAKATKAAFPLLEAINAGKIPKFAEGGLVSTDILTVPTAMPQSSIVKASTESTQVFNINITGDVSRQTRAEIAQMLPQIAVGVNSYNREKAIRR